MIMEKKIVIVVWDKEIFDGELRLLPNSNKIYSQIYDVPEKGSSWSLVFEFDETPRIQGYKSKGKVHFLTKDGPHDILKNGFRFDFLDGPRVIGHCEILEEQSPCSISEIETRIALIEEEKKDFRDYVNKLIQNNSKFGSNELINLFKYIDQYPYLFRLILLDNEQLAKDYLKKYFFKPPIESNAVYHSNLSFFTYQLKSALGEDAYKRFLIEIPDNVKNHHFIKNSIEEISSPK